MTRHHLGHLVRSTLWGALALGSSSIVGSGCLDRPVVPATPTVTARVVEQAKQNKVAKIDLLFMIDNSSSMADKQSVLAAAVPDLVNRLVTPACIDPATGLEIGTPTANGSCTMGERDFDAVKDIHIGIISSSLGSHGATNSMGAEVCPDPDVNKTNPHNKDMSHLLTRTLPNGLNGAEGTAAGTPKGFLNWTGSGSADTTITTPFANMVAGVGQHGCGYEASLEAIYRFLNDPNPYASITIADKDPTTGNPGHAEPTGTDNVLLQQRRDFLRPDSLVAVIAVTDENDCSINDNDPQGFFALLGPVSQGGQQVSAVRRGTSACDTNPNGACCFNCGVSDTPGGCMPAAQDPACVTNGGILTRASDPENLRCWNQKARYGKDFLFPVDRYIEGFTAFKVHDRTNALVNNPLYSDLNCVGNKDANNNPCVPTGSRDPSFVFFAGIVGVPWQLIAQNPTDLTKGYKTSKQLLDDDVWKTILGDPNPANLGGPVPPADLHMIESTQVRAGLPNPNSAFNADPINGHEWDITKNGPPNSDLQYACVFDLPTPTDCDPSNTDCDCNDGTGGTVADMKNPLCQDRTTGAYGHRQFRAKAYPGIRELQVLKGIGEQAIVASICPANLSNDPTLRTRADFGYRPAISALISRLRTALRGKCLPRTLEILPDGTSPCVIIEAFNPAQGQSCPPCADPSPTSAFRGRQDIPKDDLQLITPDISAAGTCRCEIKQLTDADLTACQTQVAVPGVAADGWCYVDPAQQEATGATPAQLSGACSIVSTCPATDKRVIRFAHDTSEPRSGATAFITCQERAFPSNGSNSGVSYQCPNAAP